MTTKTKKSDRGETERTIEITLVGNESSEKPKDINEFIKQIGFMNFLDLAFSSSADEAEKVVRRISAQQEAKARAAESAERTRAED